MFHPPPRGAALTPHPSFPTRQLKQLVIVCKHLSCPRDLSKPCWSRICSDPQRSHSPWKCFQQIRPKILIFRRFQPPVHASSIPPKGIPGHGIQLVTLIQHHEEQTRDCNIQDIVSNLIFGLSLPPPTAFAHSGAQSPFHVYSSLDCKNCRVNSFSN